MKDFIKSYIKYVILHKWNRLDEKYFDLIEKNWGFLPENGLRGWLYRKIKKINKAKK